MILAGELAADARLLGHGGVRAVAEVAGVSETKVRKGMGLHLSLDADREGEHPLMNTLRGSRCLAGVRRRFRVALRRAGRGSR